jgi:hypothetical protein
MSKLRRFRGAPVVRVIFSVRADTVQAIDELLDPLRPGPRHPAEGCRSEYVRLAVEAQLARDLKESKIESDAYCTRRPRARGLKL